MELPSKLQHKNPKIITKHLKISCTFYLKQGTQSITKCLKVLPGHWKCSTQVVYWFCTKMTHFQKRSENWAMKLTYLKSMTDCTVQNKPNYTRNITLWTFCGLFRLGSGGGGSICGSQKQWAMLAECKLHFLMNVYKQNGEREGKNWIFQKKKGTPWYNFQFIPGTCPHSKNCTLLHDKWIEQSRKTRRYGKEKLRKSRRIV